MLKPATGETFVAGTYYIVIPAITLSGFSISFINSDDSKLYTRTSTKENTFNRSKVKDFGTFGEEDGFPWTSVIESNGIVKASQQVDLGLEVTINSTKFKVIFAKSNLTATGLAAKESDFGDYFAWGATEPWCTAYKRTTSSVTALAWDNTKNYKTYNWSTVPFRDGTNNSCNKYTTEGNVLEMSDDAANVILGGNWQLPTKEIWENLYNTTCYKWDWTQQDGYNGYRVTSISDNSKSIFVPVARYISGDSFKSGYPYGYYWSGTANSSTNAYSFYFKSSTVNAGYIASRYYGFTVRPVRLVVVD